MYLQGTYKNNNPEDFRNHIRKNTDIDKETGCWNFKGAHNSRGYGHVRFFGRYAKIYRVSYWAFKDNDFTVMDNTYELIMHSCDNPFCCNPEHLSPGTHRENQEDSMIKKNGKISLSLEKRDYFVRRREMNIVKSKLESLASVEKINLVLKFPVTNT